MGQPEDVPTVEGLIERVTKLGSPVAFQALWDGDTQGWMVCLLSDRDLSRSGVEVEFFGGRTRMPAGPAILAIRTGAPLYAVTLSFTPTQTYAVLHPVVPPVDGPLDVRVKATTQMLADAYAAGIADRPQDWHMLQRLWL